MKRLILTTLLGIALTAGPALAQPSHQVDFGGPLQGSTVTPASGGLEVVSSGGHQYIKFSEDFSVASQAETEIRHIDGQTGAVTTLGNLASRKGYQVYEVPQHLVIDGSDTIVLYSPLHADDLATVELDR